MRLKDVIDILPALVRADCGPRSRRPLGFNNAPKASATSNLPKPFPHLPIIMARSPNNIIERARTAQDLQDARSLFSAYAKWLKIDLEFQGFAEELDSLPGKYSPPQGEILLARNDNGHIVGCVAVRPLVSDERLCEMKRLYVLSEGRHLGIGIHLVRTILDVATDLGYREMRLDTLSSMHQAIALYEKIGFQPIDPYYPTPLSNTLFFAKKLS